MRYFFIILILAALNSNAQTAGDKGKITGKVTDSGTRQPVDYATVSLFKQGSTSPFNGISTDPKGDFIIGSVPAGDYRLTIDFLGYKRYTAEHVIVTDGGTMALGTILLQPVQNQLKGVEIVAKAPVIENRIDKMVYNAQNDLTAQSGAAIDVLKKVPQVTVDIDGNVELQGNANIRFLINGKPSSIFGASLADALQAIPGSQIKSIEVITSPGAKYDAAGTGGIINIILKDNKVQGINGSVNLTAATRQENGSFNLNARKGNFGVNAFFSGNAQLNTTVLNTNNRTSTGSNGDVTRLFQQGSADTKRSGYQSGLNFNWSITPKDELTASVGFDHFGNHSNGITSQQQTLKDFTSGDILSDLISLRNSDSRFSAYSTDLSLSYKKNFKKEGQELDFLVTTSNSKNTANYLQTQDYLNDPRETTGIRGNNPGNDRETNISIDYTHPITKTFTIEGGAKAVIEDLKNTTVTDTLLGGNYVNNADQSYTFNYKRNIYAAYLSTSSSLFNKFLDVKLGLRNEYTTTSTDFSGVTIPGYNTLAPSAVISHKIGGTQSIKLSYSYRIERPDYGEINPFYNISDPNNISTGNPNLKPEKSNSFELGYNRSFNSGANFYIGSFYRHNTDDIQQFAARYDELDINGKEYTNVLLTQRANLGIQASLGGNIFISVPVTSKLNLRSNMFLVQRTNKAPGIDSIKALQYRVNLNASYQFAGNFMAEAFGNYNSSTRTLQGNRPKFFFYTMAVRKQFWDKKASIGLVANNAFSRYINQESVTRGPGFNQSTIRQLPFRSFGITLSYKFGKLEFSKEKEKEGHEENGNLPAESAGR